MNRFFKVFCFLAVVGLLAAPSAWGAGIAWVGGAPAGPQDVTIAANWNPAPSGDPNNLDSWFINTDSTGNYPIYDGVGAASLTIWDFMLGRSDNWSMTHPLTGPGYFKQTGGNLNINATFQLGQGNAGLMDTYEFAGGVITKAANGDSKVGTEGATAQMIMSNGAQFNQAGWGFYVGNDGGSVGTLTMSGGAGITNSNGPFIAGRNGGHGTVDMSGGSFITVNNEFIVGVDPGSVGVLTIANANISTLTNEFRVGQNQGQGTVTVGDGVTISVGDASHGCQFHIGQDNNSVGTLTMNGTGSSITATGEFDIGAWGGTGTMTIGAGNTFQANGWSSVGKAETATPAWAAWAS